MPRSVKKGPFIDEKLLKKIKTVKMQKEKKQIIKTWSRRSTVIPEMVGLTIAVHNGKKFIPVFITETGWPHEEGTTFHPEWHDQHTVAEYYKIAMRDLYGPDGRVVAVAPFILKYDNYDNFAFVKPDGSKYPQWDAIVSLPKTTGAPPL